MSLLFKYRRVPILRPAVALGGVLYRPRPIVRVTLINASATAITDGLLDTGADDTVFPESTALHLGIDLTGAPTGEVRRCRRALTRALCAGHPASDRRC
jgi:hypothetical protein